VATANLCYRRTSTALESPPSACRNGIRVSAFRAIEIHSQQRSPRPRLLCGGSLGEEHSLASRQTTETRSESLSALARVTHHTEMSNEKSQESSTCCHGGACAPVFPCPALSSVVRERVRVLSTWSTRRRRSTPKFGAHPHTQGSQACNLQASSQTSSGKGVLPASTMQWSAAGPSFNSQRGASPEGSFSSPPRMQQDSTGLPRATVGPKRRPASASNKNSTLYLYGLSFNVEIYRTMEKFTS